MSALAAAPPCNPREWVLLVIAAVLVVSLFLRGETTSSSSVPNLRLSQLPDAADPSHSLSESTPAPVDVLKSLVAVLDELHYARNETAIAADLARMLQSALEDARNARAETAAARLETVAAQAIAAAARNATDMCSSPPHASSAAVATASRSPSPLLQSPVETQPTTRGSGSGGTAAPPAWRKCVAAEPFLGWTNATYERARGTYANFRALATTRAAWDTRTDSDLFALNPRPIPCGNVGRLGPALPDDGGKVTCGFNALPAPCVIYSLGGNLEWSFDEAAVAATSCDVFVFDCTVDPAAFRHVNPRIHPISACIADTEYLIPAGEAAPQLHLHSSAPWDRRFTTIPTLMRELGHAAVHYLKMDIEGYEYEVIAGMLRSVLVGSADAAALPVQIAFEQHLVLNVGAERREVQPWRAMTPFLHLAELGYVVTSFEQNPICTQCAEWHVTRAWC